MEFFFSFIKVKNPNSAEGESCNLPMLMLDTRLRCLEIYKPFVTPSALEKEKVDSLRKKYKTD